MTCCSSTMQMAMLSMTVSAYTRGTQEDRLIGVTVKQQPAKITNFRYGGSNGAGRVPLPLGGLPLRKQGRL